MKILYPNIITTASATQSDENYPVSNALNYQTKKVWRSNAPSYCVVSFGFDGSDLSHIVLFHTNIAGAAYAVKDTGGSTLKSGTVAYLTGDYVRNVVFIEFGEVVSSADRIEFTISSNTDSYHFIGTAVAGTMTEYHVPDYGYKISYQEYSDTIMMKDATAIVRKGESLLKYDFNIKTSPNSHGESELIKMIRRISPLAVPVQIVSENFNRVIFGTLSVSGNLASHNRIDNTVSITERA